MYVWRGEFFIIKTLNLNIFLVLSFFTRKVFRKKNSLDKDLMSVVTV